MEPREERSPEYLMELLKRRVYDRHVVKRVRKRVRTIVSDSCDRVHVRLFELNAE